MAKKSPDEVGGLLVSKSNRGGWAVIHVASGLNAVCYLRQRRFAEQARDELLATGTDFTQDKTAVQRERARWADVYYRWNQRVRQDGLDPITFEHYAAYSAYGDVIPSAARAAELAAKAMLAWTVGVVSDPGAPSQMDTDGAGLYAEGLA
jgi:hypothetical protein